MAAARRGLVALLILVLAAGWTGCSTVAGNSTDNAKIISALKLQKSGSGGYVMSGNPFCRIEQLLNDGNEVEDASKQPGREDVLTAPSGEVGVVVRQPFAPSCSHQAEDALKRLGRLAKSSG
jgi:hypothetical protein